MKINGSPKPVVSSRSELKTKPETPSAMPTAAQKQGWVAGAAAKSDARVHHEAKKQLTGIATNAVAAAVAGHSDATPAHKHPVLEKLGEAMGLGLGVVVTEALALSKDWRSKLVDAQGKPVQHIEGADRIGNHDLQKRHQEVVGPKISALVDKMAPGAIHDLLEGLGKGATEAPGASYRLESKISDLLK